jgi:hypothetical protein
MKKIFWIRILFINLCLLFLSIVVFAGDRNIPVSVIAKPQQLSFAIDEPILIEVEIENGLKEEIRMNAFSLSPNEWNGEVACIELSDMYRLPKIFQIYYKRPEMDIPINVAGMASYPIQPGASKKKIIDARKWQVVDGWISGKYQIVVRVDCIDVDEYSSMSIKSDPIIFEIK